MTLPKVTFQLDDGTGSFPHDVSKYVLLVDGFSFNRGRADWQGSVTPGQLSLTFNNSDGRFTSGSTTIASPSPIKVDQRLRVQETINGVTVNRFTGYVKSWPVAWPGTVSSFATATVTVTDAQARAERWQLASTWIGNGILAAAPDRYWPLNDAAGTTTVLSIGKYADSFATVEGGADIVFGATTPPGSTASTAATFAGGDYLSMSSPSSSPTTACGFVVAFATTATNVAIASLTAGSDDLFIGAGGQLRLGPNTSVATFNDGLPHVVAIRCTAPSATADIYVDGSLVIAGAGFAFPPNGTLTLGHPTASVISNFTGTIGHFAQWDTAPSAAVMQSISASLPGFAADTTTQSAVRIAGYAGISSGTVDTGLTTMPNIDLAEMPAAWSLVEDASASEVGAAYINGSGTLDFHNRDEVRTKTSPDLTLVAHQYVKPEAQPTVDDQQLINYFEGTSSVTNNPKLARNATSETTHGRYPGSQTFTVSTDDEALDRANWIVANFAEPTARYGTLTINLFKMPDALAATVLQAVDIDCWLRVTGLPSQNPTGTTADVVIQGFTETCSGDTWELVCNVVSRDLYNALILDSATYGVLDSTAARLGV